MVDWSITIQCSLHQLICFADSVRYLAFNDFLSVETIHRHLCICSYDNAVCLCNLTVCQYILGSTGTSCLDLDKTVLCFGSFLDSLCCHIGMCDTSRTGSNRKDLCLCSLCRTCICKSLINIFLLTVSLINDVHKLIYGRSISEGFCKFFIHQHHRKFTEYIQMNVILCIWCCDQKQ